MFANLCGLAATKMTASCSVIHTIEQFSKLLSHCQEKKSSIAARYCSGQEEPLFKISIKEGILLDGVSVTAQRNEFCMLENSEYFAKCFLEEVTILYGSFVPQG